MKYLKQFENFNQDSEVQYSVVDVGSNYRIFAQTPVMRKKGLQPEDCELLFGKGTMWKDYLSWEDAQAAIDSLVDTTIDEREPVEEEPFDESVVKFKELKSYKKFTNEEISLGNILRTGALATSLALSQPSQAITNQPTQTEMSIEQQSVDWEDTVQCPGQSKSDIHSKISQKLRTIPGLRITSSSPDKLVCSLMMKSKPKNSNGQTSARIEIQVSEGQYTIKFVDINFVYVGVQPNDPVYNTGQNIKGQIGNELTRTVVRNSGNSVLGNMAGSVIHQATRPQVKEYKNFTYHEADSYYQSQVNSEIMSIVSTLRF